MAKEMLIQKSVTLNSDKQTVFNYLRLVRNQEHFSLWNMADPDKKVTSKGTDGNVGFVYCWDSDNKQVGAGCQEIKNINEGVNIDYELRFERPMKSIAQASFYIKPIAENKTEVTWSFKGVNKFPMSLFAPFLKKMLGKQMAESLDNLENIFKRN